jgi:hypothetical protein
VTTRTMPNAFVKFVCIGVLAAVALAGCSSTLPQPEEHQVRAADPLTSPAASLIIYEALQAPR